MPKYLEVMLSTDCPVDSDGYEIPRSGIKIKENGVKRPSSSTTSLVDNHQDHVVGKDLDRVLDNLANIGNLLAKDVNQNRANGTAILVGNKDDDGCI